MSAPRILLVAVATALLGACATMTDQEPDRGYALEPRRSTEAPQPASDTMSLHDRVHAALRREMGAAANGITVVVDGTTVRLGGHVESQADHDRAHAIAHRVAGVTRVTHDDLVVH